MTSQSVDIAKYSYDHSLHIAVEPMINPNLIASVESDYARNHNVKLPFTSAALSKPKDAKYYCPYYGPCNKAKGRIGALFTSRSGILKHILNIT